MKEIFVVNQVKLGKQNEEFHRHAFSDMEEAERFCINFLYNSSTLEDRHYNKVQIDDFPPYKQYSLYTNFYGEITLRIRKVNLD